MTLSAVVVMLLILGVSCSQVLGLLAYAALTTIILSTILLLTPGERFVMQIEREVPSILDDIIRQHSTLK